MNTCNFSILYINKIDPGSRITHIHYQIGRADFVLYYFLLLAGAVCLSGLLIVQFRSAMCLFIFFYYNVLFVSCDLIWCDVDLSLCSSFKLLLFFPLNWMLYFFFLSKIVCFMFAIWKPWIWSLFPLTKFAFYKQTYFIIHNNKINNREKRTLWYSYEKYVKF